MAPICRFLLLCVLTIIGSSFVASRSISGGGFPSVELSDRLESGPAALPRTAQQLDHQPFSERHAPTRQGTELFKNVEPEGLMEHDNNFDQKSSEVSPLRLVRRESYIPEVTFPGSDESQENLDGRVSNFGRHNTDRTIRNTQKLSLKKRKRSLDSFVSSGPSLSIVNPMDVLRQRLMLEIARRRFNEGQNHNSMLLKSIGR